MHDGLDDLPAATRSSRPASTPSSRRRRAWQPTSSSGVRITYSYRGVHHILICARVFCFACTIENARVFCFACTIAFVLLCVCLVLHAQSPLTHTDIPAQASGHDALAPAATRNFRPQVVRPRREGVNDDVGGGDGHGEDGASSVVAVVATARIWRPML